MYMFTPIVDMTPGDRMTRHTSQLRSSGVTVQKLEVYIKVVETEDGPVEGVLVPDCDDVAMLDAGDDSVSVSGDLKSGCV